MKRTAAQEEHGQSNDRGRKTRRTRNRRIGMREEQKPETNGAERGKWAE
jgi:hypothetical protein